jgi:spermidine synthase
VRFEVDHGVAELVGEVGRPRAWTLVVNGTAQSHVDLDDPTHLEFEYVRRIGHVVDLVTPLPPAPLRVLHLGGGGWTLARYVAATRPGSAQRVVELDAALAELVAARLPVEGLTLAVEVGDARDALERAPSAGADVVVVDVFGGCRVPAHLLSLECVQAGARVVGPAGVYVANIADAAPLAFARGQVAAFAEVFAHVAVLVGPEILRGRRFGNLVLLGSAVQLPVRALTRRLAADPFRARVLDDAAARGFAGDASAPRDATATPSPLPPPGVFGRPA